MHSALSSIFSARAFMRATLQEMLTLFGRDCGARG
jgi:hypothetical protein